MSEFKKGGSVSAKDFIKINVMPHQELNVINVYGEYAEVGHSFMVHKDWVKPFKRAEMTYQNSNRYKLKTYAKSKGKLIALSVAMGKQQAFLSSISSESRFNERGDISNTELNQLKTDVDSAERVVNGVPAKVVDELKISDSSDLIKNSEHFNKCNDDLSKLKARKVIKSKTEVSRKAVGFVIFLIVVLFIFAVTGVVKHIFF